MTVRQKERKTEIENDSKTERQKGRTTERHVPWYNIFKCESIYINVYIIKLRIQ